MEKIKQLLKSKRVQKTLGIIFFVVFGILFYYGATRNEEPVTEIVQPVLPKESPPPAKIVVGEGVFVRNFKESSEKLPGGDDKLDTADIYDIIYFDGPDSFLISILSPDFDFARQVAEKDFLEQLEISEDEACSLKVTVNTPAYINQNLAGRNFPLSFCE